MLACPLHRPTGCIRQTSGHDILSDAALSHHDAVGGGVFLGDVKPPSLYIRWSVDHLGACVIESYME
jgi:hypothetical protein